MTKSNYMPGKNQFSIYDVGKEKISLELKSGHVFSNITS
jgi:hypothetical protein